ncbi:phage portal protein [Sphingomonas sp. Leaf28]|uniref:phage portal protein n=1 Tax=Sphingomonas sp. Leaf28 TaxID=1735695 RepID=UPI0006F7E81A|nr:phage portal protein [Sphingomonas sp. Leaf28]KQN09080.1 hypothetical protein ASE79_14605 [Sphingomonas sp. Leaf28]
MGVFDFFRGAAGEVLAKNADDILAPHLHELLDVAHKDFDYSNQLPISQTANLGVYVSQLTGTEWGDCKTFAKKAELLLQKCPVSRACIEMRAQGIQNVTLKISDSRATKRMLASPNAVERTTGTFLKNAEIGLSVGGDLYVFYDLKVPGLPQMHTFRQDLMFKNVEKKRFEYVPGKLRGDNTPHFWFNYDAAGKTTAAFNRNGVQFNGALQHISYFDPINPLQGAGAGDSAIRSVQNYLAIDDLIRRKLASGGAKNGYFKTQGIYSDADLARVQTQMAGLTSSGSTQLLAGLDFEAAQLTFAELQLDILRDKAADAICTAFGVNSAMVNVGEATHANLRGMDKIFYRNFIGPEAHWLIGQLEWGIQQYVDESATVAVDETAIQHIQDDLDDKVVKWAQSGVVTIDECRAVIGLPPLPNGEGKELAGAKAQASDETGLGQPDEKPGGETSFNANAGDRGDRNNG